ncbi:MAG: DUF2946 family protein [Thiohalospira sp.]
MSAWRRQLQRLPTPLGLALALALLVGQTALALHHAGHTHDDGAHDGGACELCLHAQHQPAPTGSPVALPATTATTEAPAIPAAVAPAAPAPRYAHPPRAPPRA